MGLLCYKHSCLSFPDLEIIKSFFCKNIAKFQPNKCAKNSLNTRIEIVYTARQNNAISIVRTNAVVDFKTFRPFSFYYNNHLYICSSNGWSKGEKNHQDHFSTARQQTSFSMMLITPCIGGKILAISPPSPPPLPPILHFGGQKQIQWGAEVEDNAFNLSFNA